MERAEAIERVLGHINAQELVELARALIRIPSVYRPDKGGNEEEVAHFVARWLRSAGIWSELEEVSPGRPNVIGILKGAGPGRTLMFEAHTDVVTEGDPREWKHPPFAAEIADGRIYGRGACDTKGNLAAALIAVKALKDSSVPLPGKIVLGVLVDEEGLMTGIKHFIRRGWADGIDGAIICEPEDNQVCIAQKGALRVRIEARGRMSHGAIPLAGLNPIPPLAEIVRRVAQLERREIEAQGQDPLLGFPSITPTVIRAPVEGEPQVNVIPARGECFLDVRTVRGQDHEALKASLAAIVADVEREVRKDLREGLQGRLREELCPGLSRKVDLSVSLEVFEERPWTETPRESPIVRAVAEAVRLVTGKEPVYNGVPGATDGTFLSAWKGIPIVTIGAGDRLVPHQVDEWVGIDQLVETAMIYAVSAIIFLNGG